MRRFFFIITALVILISPAMSFAATLTPGSYSATINVGETVTLSKTVQLDSTGPATSKVDVYFLCDNTGSMGGTITSVKANATTILNAISGGDSRFAGIDINYGVGKYLGDPVEGPWESPWYFPQQAITNSKVATQAAINAWSASGGADWEEANFYALKKVADNVTTGWRSDAGKIIVWFGDAPSHTETTTQAQAIAALNAKGIKVAAINVSPYDAGINYYGQASAIAAATGGTYTSAPNPATIVDAILNAVAAGVSKVNLSLVTSGDTSGLTVGFSPAVYTDVLPGESRTFTMSITGVTPGTYDFMTKVVGVSTEPEMDRIVVRDGHPVVPEPSTMLMIGSMLMGFVFTGKKKFMK